jgi:hypothetical protein
VLHDCVRDLGSGVRDGLGKQRGFTLLRMRCCQRLLCAAGWQCATLVGRKVQLPGCA